MVRSEIKEILVSRLRFMGDVILTTPLLNVLRENFPNARITYIAETPYHSLLENHPAVDRVWGFRLESRKDQARLFSKLLKTHFDIAIDLFGNPRSALLTYLSGAPYRIGGDFRGRKIFYTHRIKDDGIPKSAVKFHLQYLKALEISYKVYDPAIFVSPEEKTWAKQYLENRGFNLQQKIVAIHPGAAWPAKRWFPERFAALANKLVSGTGAQMFFIVNPDKEAIVQSVIDRCNFSVPVPEVLTLRHLAAVISLCDVLVSNDCGVMHMAPAVGTRVVGIFGPGEPEIWFPYSQEKGHRLVYHEIECSRCHQDFCHRMDCMKAVTVEDVYQAVLDVL